MTSTTYPALAAGSASPPSAHLQAPAHAAPQTCQGCGATIDLRKCQVQRCHNLLLPAPIRKICAECLFERNTLSMTDFHQRLIEEGECPSCGNLWPRPS